MNINKVLSAILIVVVVISLALVSFYLYTRYGNTKNNKTGVSQNSPSLTGEITSYISNAALPPAKVGTAYKATVEGGVKNLIAQVRARVESGLPPGLQLTSCETEYSSLDPSLDQNKQSIGKCTIEGTPEESGNFQVRVNFSYSVPGGTKDFITEYPLVVNP